MPMSPHLMNLEDILPTKWEEAKPKYAFETKCPHIKYSKEQITDFLKETKSDLLSAPDIYTPGNVDNFVDMS